MGHLSSHAVAELLFAWRDDNSSGRNNLFPLLDNKLRRAGRPTRRVIKWRFFAELTVAGEVQAGSPTTAERERSLALSRNEYQVSR